MVTIHAVLIFFVVKITVQQRFYDDNPVNLIHYTALLSEYQQTQKDPNMKLHPFIIRPAFDLTLVEQSAKQFHQMARLFHIAAYYFEVVILVQKIPQGQTLLKRQPVNLQTPSGKVNISISSQYATEGFNTDQIDIIVFLKNRNLSDGNNNLFISGTLQVERRPIYGFLLYQIADVNIISKKFAFHHRIQLTIHHLFHILGCSTQFFLPEPNLDVANIKLDPNYETRYFKSPYSSQRLKQSDIIMQHQDPKRLQFFIKTAQVRKLAFNLFSCEGRTSIQKMGIALTTFQKNFTIGYKIVPNILQTVTREILIFHFSNFYGLHEEVMQIKDFTTVEVNLIYRQNFKISQITLAFLRDTGFYQMVRIDQTTTDYFAKASQIKGKQDAIFHRQKFDSCTFEQLVLKTNQKYCQQNQTKTQCDIYGLIAYWQSQNQLKAIKPDEDKTSQIGCYQAHVQCQGQDLNLPRCLNPREIKDSARIAYKQNCFDAQCYVSGNQQMLKVLKDGQIFTGCKDGEDYINILQRQYQCPKNKNIFCSNQICSNQCSEKGLCIRGECVMPKMKLKYDQYVKLSSLARSSEYSYLGKSNCSILQICNLKCPIGCLICKKATYGFISCILPQPNFTIANINISDRKIGLQLNGYIPFQCLLNCKQCDFFGSITTVSRFTQYFSFATCVVCNQESYTSKFNDLQQSCNRCQGNKCTSCLQGAYFGYQCTNCPQGYFINNQKDCQPCYNLDNCISCKKRQNKFECLKCLPGYQLTNKISKLNSELKNISNIINQCTRCLPNCAVCNQMNISKCEQCFQGYYLIVSPEQRQFCYLCANNCRFCANSSFCKQCQSGYVASLTVNNQGQNKCVNQCSNQCRTCKQNQPDKCQSCFHGYELDAQNHKCNPLLSCNQRGNCTNCPDYHGLIIKQKPFINAKCVKCQYEHCLACFYSNRGCFTCEDGYYLFFKDYSCKKCPEECLTCQSSQTCLSCRKGYERIKNMDGTTLETRCVKCTHNCQTCFGAPHQCLSCLPGYSHIGRSCFPGNFSLNYTIVMQNNDTFIRERQYQQITQHILMAYNMSDQILQRITHALIDIKYLSDQKLQLTIYVGFNEQNVITQLKSAIIEIMKNKLLIYKNQNRSKDVPDGCLFEVLLDYQKAIYLNSSVISQFEISSFLQSNKSNCQSFYIKSRPKPINILIITLPPIFGGLIIVIAIIVGVYFYKKYKKRNTKVIKQQYDANGGNSSQQLSGTKEKKQFQKANLEQSQHAIQKKQQQDVRHNELNS